jgi:hypothetical protein
MNRNLALEICPREVVRQSLNDILFALEDGGLNSNDLLKMRDEGRDERMHLLLEAVLRAQSTIQMHAHEIVREEGKGAEG